MTMSLKKQFSIWVIVSKDSLRTALFPKMAPVIVVNSGTEMTSVVTESLVLELCSFMILFSLSHRSHCAASSCVWDLTCHPHCLSECSGTGPLACFSSLLLFAFSSVFLSHLSLYMPTAGYFCRK